MVAAQEIYGPHDGRLWSEGPVALGRRLFRTLPEDVHDRQPLRSRDSRFTLVADVRIDNRDELTSALGLSPADARESCDAAILLACLERWGPGALDRVIGDFAFALWDARARSLMLARDFSGARPLHYHRGRNFFAFASMPKGLHALAEIPRAPDEQTVAEFIALVPQNSSRTYFEGIHRVKPAHIVTVTREGLSTRRYWEPTRPGPNRLSATDYAEGARHCLDVATQAGLRGTNGVVGSHLSGGLDSGGVTATAARLLAPSGGKVVAFTAVPREGYSEDERSLVDEGPLAAMTAAMHPNIEHVLIRSGHLSPLATLDRTFFLCERPIRNTANWVWGQAINDAARARKLTVMLNGQMGNMTLSYHGQQLLPELLLSGRVVRLWREARQLVAKTSMTWRGVVSGAVGPLIPLLLWQWANGFYGARPNILFVTAIRPTCLATFDLATLESERGYSRTYRPGRDAFSFRHWAFGRNDIGTYRKGYLAGWGIDHRDPTADRRLAEFCLSIPTEQFLAAGVPRALARNALADRLPEAVLSGQTRGYQAADWHEGLAGARAEVAEELARLSDCEPAARVLDLERMKALLENWPTSGWQRRDITKRYRLALLRGISAGHFVRKSTGGNR